MTKQINLKNSSWSVLNTETVYFRESVLKYLKENYEEAAGFEGDRQGCYYGVMDNHPLVQHAPFGVVLKISEFEKLAQKSKAYNEGYNAPIGSFNPYKDGQEYLDWIDGAYDGINNNETTPDKSEPVRGEWVSVKDRLPDFDVSVLVYVPLDNGGTVQNAKYIQQNKFVMTWNVDIIYGVTHWQPMISFPL